MSIKPIISVLNLKNGVGCSTLAWNIGHTLRLNIYQHDKAMHGYFMEQRKKSILTEDLCSSSLPVEYINKKKFPSGIYDLGSDINYPYVRQILAKSDAVIIPVETGYEVLIKSIATIKYTREQNKECMIFIVFNNLDSSDRKRERKYSKHSKDFILSEIDSSNTQFLYMRHSFAIYKNLKNGYFFLDNYTYHDKKFKSITPFKLLRNLRWYSINKMRDTKEFKKAEDEYKKTDFFEKHADSYYNYIKDIDISTIYNLKFNDNNRKLIKDMLTLTTRIRDCYQLRWEG